MKNDIAPVTTSGNLDTTTTTKMTVDEEGMADLMAILTNMYSDAYDAALREYSANGYDSHVEAGQTRPIEVTLPTLLSPSLLIRDYGVGMSEDTVVNVYAKYTKSTKRDENGQVGGFGIGAKSAFTMGSQFVVTATKDGHQATFLFAMGEDGIPEHTRLGARETDEHDGVLISLAVEDIDRMRRTAARVFSTWPAGSVLVDGEAPDSVFDSEVRINDEVSLVHDHDGKIFATLGPVAYPVSRNQLDQVIKALGEAPAVAVARVLRDWDSETSVFFRANVGDMTIAPNREQLRDTRKTINTLAALVTGLHQDLLDSVQTRVDGAKSLYAAAHAFKAAQDDIAPLKVSRKAVKFAGLEGFQKEVRVLLPKFSIGTKNYNSTRKVVLDWAEMTIDIAVADKVLVVTEVPESEVSTVKRYARRFLEENEMGVEHILVSPASAASYGWFQYGVEGGAKTLTREKWRALLREMRGKSLRVGNEPAYTTGPGEKASRDIEDRELLTDILSWGKDIVVYHGESPRGPLAAQVLEDYTVVVLLATQSLPALEKRVEADGTVQIVKVDVQAGVKALAEAGVTDVTEAERAALAARAWISANTGWGTPLSRWQEWNKATEKAGIGVLPQVEEFEEALELATLVAADITDERVKALKVYTDVLGTSIAGGSFDFEIPAFNETFPMLGHHCSANDLVSKYTEASLVADIAEYLIAKHS